MGSTDLTSLYRAHLDRLERDYGSAIAAQKYDALVIHAGVQQSRLVFDDQDWPLVPTPAFLHWLPLREPESVLVIVPGKRPKLIRARHDSFWEGPVPAEGDHFWDAFEVVECKTGEVKASLPGGRLAFIGETTERAQAWGIGAADQNPADLTAALEAVRTVKSDYERHCIGEANRRAARGHQAAFDAFQGGDLTELELHLIYLRETAQDDSETPYKNIVALNEHAGILHHIQYGREASTTDCSLLIDAGATCMGYASDITRTRVKGGSEAASRFGKLIDELETIEQTMATRVIAGTEYEQLHNQSHELLAESLRVVGIATGDAEALVSEGVTRAFFPHGLGHSLGLQVHDVGCRPRKPAQRNPFLRATTTIAPGMVFTIEPGCYFIPSLLEPLKAEKAGSLIDWDVVASLASFGGVRIEDNIAATDSTPTNLTRGNWPS